MSFPFVAAVGALTLSLPSFTQSGAGSTTTTSTSAPSPGEGAAAHRRSTAQRPLLSWDALGGAATEGSVIAQAETGFSGFLGLGVEVAAMNNLLFGAYGGLDAGHWTPEGADNDTAFVFGLSGRMGLLHTREWSIGVSAQPGASVRLAGQGGWSLLLPLRASAMYSVDARLLLGAAIDAPIRVAFPSGFDAFLTVPMTVSIAGELHLLPSVALTAVLGLGPALDTRGVETAFRGIMGVAYRL